MARVLLELNTKLATTHRKQERARLCYFFDFLLSLLKDKVSRETILRGLNPHILCASVPEVLITFADVIHTILRMMRDPDLRDAAATQLIYVRHFFRIPFSVSLSLAF